MKIIIYIFFKYYVKKNDRVQFKITYRGIPQEGLYIGDNKYGDRTFSDNGQTEQDIGLH